MTAGVTLLLGAPLASGARAPVARELAFLGAAIKEAATKSGIDLQLLEERRQPPDHPVLLAFPEGRYLKFLVFRRPED